MKIPFKMAVLPAVLSAMLAGAVWADDDLPDNDSTDTEVVESVSNVSSESVAGMFGDFLGEDSQSYVEGLRSGDITYVPPEDAEGGAEGDAAEDVADTDEVEGVEGEEASVGMGYGNVTITLALAEQLAMASAAEALEGETGMTADDAINEVLYMRVEEGMGWGQIAKEMGFNLGEIMSGIHSNRPETAGAAKADKMTGKDMRAEKSMKPETAGPKVDKAERVKMERPERPVKPMKAERPEKPERPAKPERPERPGR
ncbi:hypothetical protein [Microbulbifer yueqingensis]|uniref:Helix-turn-helix domain-containing protein n=1 Tax=Microbulbifer yueqingensis TaxID=658219 RepID=A0A1G9A185_9GAMM|nr:hypothetical protein [Microbulbifer yueqingensis]SDK21021.1 hypothetical protein SAMN05216212_1820 [Microbulbifer yueqingensis]